jgi:2-keto-4-pentenoate hydratase
MAPAELAALLEREHRERVAFHSLLPEVQLTCDARVEARSSCANLPAPMERAYAVQDAFVERLRGSAGAPCGYKVGLTSPRMQEMCGLDEPVAGRVLAQRLLRSPAQVPLERFMHLGVESEICLTLGADLPARTTPYSLAEVARSVSSAAAAFELIDDRGSDYARLDAFTLVADNSWNEGVVLASGRATSTAELGALEGTLWINDLLVDRGHSRDTLDNPLAVVAWLASHLGRRGTGLMAGDFVMTGSVVPTRFARAGEGYRFELTGFPPVELRVL